MDQANIIMTESGNIYTALHRVYQQVEYVQKTGRNEAQRYRYAGEKDLINAVRPAMVEAGIVFFCAGITDQETREIRKVNNGRESVMLNYAANFHFTFAHASSGTSINVIARGEGSDSLDKASYKAMTGALKYALRQTFVIETGDDPDDDRNYRHRDEPVNDEQPAEPADPVQEARRILEKGAKDALAKMPGMDAAKLAAVREWMGKPAGHEMPSRWAMLAKIDTTLRDKLKAALEAREQALAAVENRQPEPQAQEHNRSPAEAAPQRKPGRSRDEEIEDALATTAALHEQDRKDPLGIAGANEREAFSALKRAMTKADATEADHLGVIYRDIIAEMPEAGKQSLQAIVVGKIEQQAAEPVA